MSTKLRGLDAGSCIVSGNRAIVRDLRLDQVNTDPFSIETFATVRGTVKGCEFTITGRQSQVESIIGMVRPYPGSGPVEVGHTYRGKHTGHNAVAVFVSEHYIVSRYDDGSEYVCTFSEFNQQYRSSFDERAFRSFHEDLHHYRGRLPDALIDACMSEAKKFK